MKKTTMVVGVLAVLAHMRVLAGSGVFYTESGKFYAKVSGLCPSGNVVQAICQRYASASVPATNAPYLGVGEALSTAPQACSVMGTDPAYVYYFGAGNLGSVNYESDLYLYGYMRAFSGTTVPGSAYFGNSPIQPINPNNQPSSDNDIPTNIIVGTVNPAYVIPMEVAPTTNWGNGLTVTGVVYASSSGGNNQLESGWLLVEWRYAGSAAWTPGTTAIGAAGQFGFNPSVSGMTTIYVRARVADAYTPSPGSPVSSEYLVYVEPEPATVLAGVLALVCMGRRLRA